MHAAVPSLVQADHITPAFGNLFTNEPLPVDGHVTLHDVPGWGVELNKDQMKLERPFKR